MSNEKKICFDEEEYSRISRDQTLADVKVAAEAVGSAVSGKAKKAAVSALQPVKLVFAGMVETVNMVPMGIIEFVKMGAVGLLEMVKKIIFVLVVALQFMLCLSTAFRRVEGQSQGGGFDFRVSKMEFQEEPVTSVMGYIILSIPATLIALWSFNVIDPLFAHSFRETLGGYAPWIVVTTQALSLFYEVGRYKAAKTVQA